MSPDFSPTCYWIQDGDSDLFQTDCGQAFQLNEGTPEENGLKFCCYCGRPLMQMLWTDETD